MNPDAFQMKSAFSGVAPGISSQELSLLIARIQYGGR
jgi:hypothetical protein